jgi:predicted DNA-binding ribbon-helix-helix protein
MTRSRATFLGCIVLTFIGASVLRVSAQAAMEFETKPLGGTNVPAPSDQWSTEIQVINLLRQTGHYGEAEARCRRILRQKPDDPAMKRLLADIQTERAQQQNLSASMRRKIESLVIPEVSVREASVSEVVDFLKEQAQTLSVDKDPINVVWEAPEETKTAKVTLSLREVPLADALRYVTESVGLRYRVDAHAIVIYIPPPAAPPHAKP